MIGRLPDPKVANFPFGTNLAWLLLMLLTYALVYLSFGYEKARISGNSNAIIRFRVAIILSSLILGFANYFSPYYRT